MYVSRQAVTSFSNEVDPGFKRYATRPSSEYVNADDHLARFSEMKQLPWDGFTMADVNEDVDPDQFARASVFQIGIVLERMGKVYGGGFRKNLYDDIVEHVGSVKAEAALQEHWMHFTFDSRTHNRKSFFELTAALPSECEAITKLVRRHSVWKGTFSTAVRGHILRDWPVAAQTDVLQYLESPEGSRDSDANAIYLKIDLQRLLDAEPHARPYVNSGVTEGSMRRPCDRAMLCP